MPPQSGPPLQDPRVGLLLDQCDRGLRQVREEMAQPRSDALAAVGRARLSLSVSAQASERAHAQIVSRIGQARAALEATAGSDRERAAVLRAELDLAEGKEVTPTLAERVRAQPSYRELVLAHAALAENEADAQRLRAQGDALDAVFAWLIVGAPPSSVRAARDIGPDLGQ